MIPELARNGRDRSDLTATRYAASIVANVTVFVIAWIVLKGGAQAKIVTPQDYWKFRVGFLKQKNLINFVNFIIINFFCLHFQNIALIITVLGFSMSILFHFSLSFYNIQNYRSIQSRQNSQTSQSRPEVRDVAAGAFDVWKILKMPILYQNALLYVCSRLFLTTSMVYMPLWLNERATNEGGGDGEVENIFIKLN